MLLRIVSACPGLSPGLRSRDAPGGLCRGAWAQLSLARDLQNPVGMDYWGIYPALPLPLEGPHNPDPPWGSQQPPRATSAPLTCRGEQPSGSGGKIRRRLLGVTLR